MILATGASFGLPGCFRARDDSPAVAIASIGARNLDDAAHTITTRVMRNGQMSVETTETLAPRDRGSESVSLVGDEFSAEPANYRLRARFEDGSTEIDAALSPVNGSTCVEYELRVTPDRQLSIWKSEASACG